MAATKFDNPEMAAFVVRIQCLTNQGFIVISVVNVPQARGRHCCRVERGKPTIINNILHPLRLYIKHVSSDPIEENIPV